LLAFAWAGNWKRLQYEGNSGWLTDHQLVERSPAGRA